MKLELNIKNKVMKIHNTEKQKKKKLLNMTVRSVVRREIWFKCGISSGSPGVNQLCSASYEYLLKFMYIKKSIGEECSLNLPYSCDVSFH